MHFLKTQLFHYTLLQKAEPNSPLVGEEVICFTWVGLGIGKGVKKPS